MFKLKVKVRLGLIGLGIAFNSSEYWRMARNIQSGKLFSPDLEHLDPAFCQFPLADVRNAMNTADTFCGLVGLKATGKTSTLELISKEQPNVVYVKMKASGNVCHALYETLKKSTYHLPWPLDLVRFDSSLTTEDRLIKVFRYVKKRSGTPVTAVIDVQPDRHSILSNLPSTHVQSTSLVDIPSVVIPSYSFDPDAREFTRQIKHLVNSRVMRCLFAASEGASFQVEHAREGCLKLFIAYELSMPSAEKYLQKM